MNENQLVKKPDHVTSVSCVAVVGRLQLLTIQSNFITER